MRLIEAAMVVEDPLWRLPLWQPYKENLNSKIADSNNVGGNFAGAITAALFLEKFVGKGIPWVHIDTFAWNNGTKPGRPEGGEALGMRAGFELIRKRFGRSDAHGPSAEHLSPSRFAGRKGPLGAMEGMSTPCKKKRIFQLAQDCPGHPHLPLSASADELGEGK